MFGFSLTKLVFTVAVIVAVWYGYKWLGRMQVKREEEARQRLRRDRDGNPGPKPDAEEMVECPACGAFVARRGAQSCGRDDCPYPG